MKIIVTHTSPDWDAITSVWLLKRYLPGWNEAGVRFVPAGERYGSSKQSDHGDAIEQINGDSVIHVDTGMGPLDHHQTSDDTVCAASVTWEYAQQHNIDLHIQNAKMKERREAIDRMVRLIVAIDHFKEVFFENPTADMHEFSLLGVLEGIKMQKPGQDMEYVEFGMNLLDATLHNFENRIYAEHEIKEKGKEFITKWGKSLSIETINDTVIKLAQKMGYMVVVRKDPRKGYVRIKARPVRASEEKGEISEFNVDLTLAYEKLKKIDPDATWFLHVSKKMLLNGTPKNPKMIPTKLKLEEIVKVLETI